MNTRQLLRNDYFREYLRDTVMEEMLFHDSDEIADWYDNGDDRNLGAALAAAIANALMEFEEDISRPFVEEVNAKRRRLGLPKILSEDDLNRASYNKERL